MDAWFLYIVALTLCAAAGVFLSQVFNVYSLIPAIIGIIGIGTAFGLVQKVSVVGILEGVSVALVILQIGYLIGFAYSPNIKTRF